MGSLSEFRPPQFSEDDVWLPPWLQQCDIKRLNVEGFNKDHATFEQRVEELQFLRKSISSGESCREVGGCNIGHLLLSGADCSPLSFAQSVDDVVQFHLRLSSDGNSENTTLTNDACQTESNFSLQHLDNSAILNQKNINLSLFYKSGAINLSPSVELESPVHRNELLKHEESVKSSEAAADAVELCIAASEALVINEVINSDPFAKSSSASAILEASLQVKQARLEVWKNPFSGSIGEISDIDDLSDLDDKTMESAFEDAGIHFDKLPEYELSVSQVKDTFDFESEGNLKFENRGCNTANYGKSSDDSSMHNLEGVLDNDIQFEKDLSAECYGGDTQKKVPDNPAIVLGTGGVGYQNDLLMPIQAQGFGLSVSEENVNAPVAEKVSHETNASSSPINSCRDAGNDGNSPNTVQERFQSRWFGGWTWKNEYVATVKHTIPGPFAGETSFLSESADVAPDGNSFAQNHDKGAIASQLSIPSENFSNRGNEILLTQDFVRSSSASFWDPLCSVVPCSISENICSSPTIIYGNQVFPRHSNITVEHTNDSMLGAPASNNELAQAEKVDMSIPSIEKSQRVCRKSTLLRTYSKLLPDNANYLGKDSHQKRSFFVNSNSELAFHETPFTNCDKTLKGRAELPVLHKGNSRGCPLLVNGQRHRPSLTSSCIRNLAKENPSQTAAQENKINCPPSENLQWPLLKCTKQTARQSPSSKHVHFSENKSDTPENKKLQKVQIPSKNGCTTRAARRSTRGSLHLESRPQQPKFLKSNINEQKKRLIFQNMEFMLTGFSRQKEKEIDGLIRKYGGIVLSQIPSTNLKGKRSSKFKPHVLPIVICLKKRQSLKFLYGCSVNAFLLKVNWLLDSIATGFVLPPKKYMVLSRNIDEMHAQLYTPVNYDNHSLIFNNLGIMLHGKTRFFTSIATIIKGPCLH
ncbi:hypothetical protein ACJIZ3_018629 [Penstemon smallii]|uniref:BRCT domain-containing protein n=1 Tax=Penstemon smallii TaxID=265156 RepID=A0ABD3SYY5_9LAMI